MSENRHENYELLNLLGYGLAKFNMQFVKRFGFKTKTAFYNHIVALDIAETPGVVKNRQDLFDPFFSNGRRGWWQKGDAYIHRKLLIDSLFGDLDVSQYVTMMMIYIEEKFGDGASTLSKKFVSPVIKSKFKQLQLTGRAAELHFMNNYNDIESFATGIIDDGRLYGDGYDFQIEVSGKYYLAEIKGVRGLSGSVRLTKNEFLKANEFQNEYALVIVSNLDGLPKMTPVFNPIVNMTLTEKVMTQSQTTYHSELISW